ncbi:MAG: sigma-70 family RNA polymerase sigma factor [Anaerolineae bacterium]|nr:sigma-70 family RNA polymerase sigma factor [Anaerolineae bacterium]
MVRNGQDGSLLERVQEYDPSALGEIYDRYAGRIYNYIYYRLGDAHLAEDLTGTVFVKMLEAIQGSRAWNISFSGWLYRIAHNLVVDHFRRCEQDRATALDERLVAGDQDPVKMVERQMEGDRLRRAISQLTYEQGLVITLKFAEGLSNAEVARMIGKTEGAIKSLQFRAMASLRRILEATE